MNEKCESTPPLDEAAGTDEGAHVDETMLNRDLSDRETFEEVRRELGLSVGPDGLYRTDEGQIVLFRGQEIDYPDALRASTDPETSRGQYGSGAYFGNSPAAVGQYVLFGNHGIQAYLLPKLDEDKIERVSRRRSRRQRHEPRTSSLQIFRAPIPVERRVTHTRGEGPDQILWVRVPSSAQDVIDDTKKLAYLGHVGIGRKRFGNK